MKELIITIVALLSWIFVFYALGKVYPFVLFLFGLLVFIIIFWKLIYKVYKFLK